MEHAKMIKTANGLDTFCKITQRFIAVAIVVMLVACAVLTVVNLVNPDAVLGEGLATLEAGDFTLAVSEDYTPDNRTVLWNMVVMSATGAAFAAAMWYAFGQIRKMLAPVKEGQPFCDSVCDALSKLSKCVLVMGVLHNVGREISNMISLNLFPVEQLLESGVVTYVTVNHELDLSFLVAFFFLRLMVFIFRYGMQLQQLSDETL
ncbi:MAG: hypothetical protein IKK21_05855 [Clostridia bacterium]|nr:hypothetical protein [Clostridia bacterium]